MSGSNENRAEESAPDEKLAASMEESGDGTGEQPDGSSEEETAASEERPDLERIDALEREVADLKDQLLRKHADFENFRKRMFREREEAVRFANSSLLSDLVDVIDNFERAIRSSEESRDFGAFHRGVELIEKQFTGMLESKWGLKRFDSVGEVFDPERHQAIASDASGDGDTQKVIEDYQRGYLLHDRVLRPAKVKVLLPAAQTDGDASTDEERQRGND